MFVSRSYRNKTSDKRRQLISNFFNGSIWICLPTLVQLLFVFVDFFFVFFKNSLINFQVLPRLWCYKSSWNQRSVHAGLTLRSGQLKCSTSYWEKYNLKPLKVVIAPCNFSPPTQNFTREQLSASHNSGSTREEEVGSICSGQYSY